MGPEVCVCVCVCLAGEGKAAELTAGGSASACRAATARGPRQQWQVAGERSPVELLFSLSWFEKLLCPGAVMS